ncbi:MAG: hypothetical protein HQL20_05255 [Candidatus Omnitrophica bacterium]|nr:hypothetical protein [Candidatus Omnitrophota bacterium]
MKKLLAIVFGVLVFLAGMVTVSYAAEAGGKTRILVVSSYSRDYLWSQETGKGLNAALREFKFLDNDQQVEEFSKNDSVETASVIIKKSWMDTKRKSKKEEIVATTAGVMDLVRDFKPDLVFLGDDNATNFVGAQLINTATPVVFWGVDLDPFKYGYIDSFERPGKNITGVYQSGYYKEGLEALKKLYPQIKTFAILSDESETGRGKGRVLAKEAAQGKLPLELVDEVYTKSFSEWKTRALELQGKVDAFFVITHATLKEDDGSSVDIMKAGAWYQANIKKPEAVPEKHMVEAGLLLTADDSAYKQGYEAGRMADIILHGKKAPGEIAVMAPSRGAIAVNRLRAQSLGIDLTGKDFIEEFVDGSKALEKFPQP